MKGKYPQGTYFNCNSPTFKYQQIISFIAYLDCVAIIILNVIVPKVKKNTHSI